MQTDDVDEDVEAQNKKVLHTQIRIGKKLDTFEKNMNSEMEKLETNNTWAINILTEGI